jgi:hypothetical protein
MKHQTSVSPSRVATFGPIFYGSLTDSAAVKSVPCDDLGYLAVPTSRFELFQLTVRFGV